MIEALIAAFHGIIPKYNTPTQRNNKDLKAVHDMYHSELNHKIGPVHIGFEYDVRLVPSKPGLAPLSFVDPSAPGRKDTVASYVVPPFLQEPAIEVTEEFFTENSRSSAQVKLEGLSAEIVNHKWRKEGVAAQRVAFNKSYTGELSLAPK